MTVTEPELPGLSEAAVRRTAASGTSQWFATAWQVINWGGFDGYHSIPLAEGSTLISGASGVGKSTLLDAYLALMMPRDTSFNGASNDVGGRARNVDQRSEFSYIRGVTDTAHLDGGDELREQVLRGNNGDPCWGSIAMTFRNTAGRLFTVGRIYYVRPGGTLNSDVAITYFTVPSALELRRLAPLVGDRFNKRSLRGAIPSIVPHDTYREFEQEIHSRLTIGGTDGLGGKKAMRLLARIQGGMQVKRVDSLYKTMVLEQPVTYEFADKAIDHFAELEGSYLKMADDAQKARALRDLPDLQTTLAQAEKRSLLIEQIGFNTAGASPFMLWRLRTEQTLLATAVAQNRAEHGEQTTKARTARAEESRLKEQLERIAADKRANGGSAIDERQAEISRLEPAQQAAYAASIIFADRTAALELHPPRTAEEFAEVRASAEQFLSEFATRQEQLEAQVNEINRTELYRLTAKQADLLTEKSSLANRNGAVPARLDTARRKMAEAAGLDPDNDLPFVAELIDVRPECDEWRTAAETTLGGLARVVLVDRQVREHLSSSIDRLVLSPRINFRGIDLADYQPTSGKPGYISGVLEFKDSPFAAWVQSRVMDSDLDHLCVDSVGDLNGPGPRVVRSGQTRRGDQGAHGSSGEGNILGFSNVRRLADIERQLAELDPQIETVKTKVKELNGILDRLRRRRDAFLFVTATTWEAIDHEGIATRIDDLRKQIEALRHANEILDALQAEEDTARPLLNAAVTAAVRAEDRLETLTKKHGELVDDEDSVSRGIESIEDAGEVEVSAPQQEHLDALLAARGDLTAETCAAAMRDVKTRLGEDLARTNTTVRSAISQMERMFESYQSRWPEKNLGVTRLSAEGYLEILDRIVKEGIHERRDKWRRQVAEWSSEDLVNLNDAFDSAIEEIEDRLVPINAILAGLPFGGKGHLRIKVRRLHNEEVAKFRKQLRKLSSGITSDLTEEHTDARFKELRAFLTQIKKPEGNSRGSTSTRDRFLDVRQHCHITATCLDSMEREVATYDSLGGKSGGETQELVAFIVGAALRYQLGDEEHDRPRYAPVFLDEGFVKADSEFAGRAIRAWQKLGFQLIIAAPHGTVTALEPFMDLMLTVTKNSAGYSFVREVRPADPPQDPDAA